jgi:hypothetical protein
VLRRFGGCAKSVCRLSSGAADERRRFIVVAAAEVPLAVPAPETSIAARLYKRATPSVHKYRTNRKNSVSSCAQAVTRVSEQRFSSALIF